jgi:hypothetical protein
MSQYLNEETLVNTIPVVKFNISDLVSADTYNETLMLEHFNKYSDNEKQLLIKAAAQIAIIGAGGRNYGSIFVDDKNTMKIEALFAKLGVKFNEKINSKYDPSVLSARRLVRLLRYQIKGIIIKNQRPSYLWLKYSDKNKDYIGICFPSGEHLVKTKDEAVYLLNTYITADIRLNTRFTDRIKRIYIARDIMTPIEIEDHIKLRLIELKVDHLPVVKL